MHSPTRHLPLRTARPPRSCWLAALVLATVLPLAATAATPAAAENPGLEITGAWVRLLPGALPAAGYFTLQNTTDHAVKLVGASSTSWARADLHHSMTHDGSSMMMPVASVTVPAHGRIQFSPGGYHIMLQKAQRPLKAGGTASISLQLANGDHLTAAFALKPAAATGP